MENKKSQISGLGISVIISIMLFMIGMIVMNFIKTEVTNARTGISCSDATISDGSKMLCLILDITLPYVIILIISVSGGLITQRLVT